MSFRLVSLFVAPSVQALGFTHYHSAALERGALRLRGEVASDHYPSDTPPMKALVDNAMRREWSKKVSDYASQLDAAMEEGLEKESQESRPNSKASLSEWLAKRGPWIVSTLDRKEVQRNFPKSALGILRNLKDDGTAILSRKTVFLVPDFLPDLKQETQHLPAITRAIAAELNTQLDDLKDSPVYGFLKLCPNHRQVSHPDEPGLMFEIIRRLLIETSSFTLDKSNGLQQFEKEGPLLMDGPTGTGKSMSAELIARQQGKPITKVNISAISESLLESRMRGYVKGTFTGALADGKLGWFAEANGGILFLDEFQNASLPSQAQLLDLLDPVSNDVYVSQMGDESNPKRYSVKVILATNRPVDELLSSGRLREDLYYRIREVVKLRPLNELIGPTTEINSEKADQMVRGLFYLYRWKSAPPVSLEDEGYSSVKIFSSESDCASLFPIVDELAIERLRTFDWKGNFRQFERVICDIHWENDRNLRSEVTLEVVERVLEKEERRLSSGQHIAAITSIDSVTLDRINTVQTLLQAYNFNINKVLAALKPFKIGLSSRPSLRNFLQRNANHLRPEVRKDSKLELFLNGRQPSV